MQMRRRSLTEEPYGFDDDEDEEKAGALNDGALNDGEPNEEDDDEFDEDEDEFEEDEDEDFDDLDEEDEDDDLDDKGGEKPSQKTTSCERGWRRGGPRSAAREWDPRQGDGARRGGGRPDDRTRAPKHF